MTMVAGKSILHLRLAPALLYKAAKLTRYLCVDAWLLPVLDLRFTHKGKPLLASDHFSDHNIVDGSTIQCFLRAPRLRRRMLLRR